MASLDTSNIVNFIKCCTYNSNAFCSISVSVSIFGSYRDVSINGDGLSLAVDIDTKAKVDVKGKVNMNLNIEGGINVATQMDDSRLDIVVENDASLNLNRNLVGLKTFATPLFLVSNITLNVDVKQHGTFESCGNKIDMWLISFGAPKTAPATTFSGDGYYCDQSTIEIDYGDYKLLVPPVCQTCP